jgi:hypothetical protein
MCKGMNERSVSVVVARREKKKGGRVVVCEYNGSVVDKYEEELKEGECRCGEEREEERGKSREEEVIR